MNPGYSLKRLARPQYLTALTFLAMLVVSWRRWSGMIIDLGRETDLPLRILNGEVLYRDIHYLYPPFSPYFNALLYRLFGTHLDTLSGSGIVLSLIAAFLSYRIARRLMGPLQASIATSLVIVLCLFKPSGDAVLPYSFAAVHGMIFSMATLLFVLRHAESGRRRDLALAGVFIGLTAITKQEFAFASALTLTASLVFEHRTAWRRMARDLLWATVPAVVVAVPVFGVLFALVGWRTLIVDCHLLLTHLPDSLLVFNAFRSGFDHPLGSIIQMTGAAAECALLVVMMVLVGDRRGILRPRLIAWLVPAAAVFTLILFSTYDQWDGSPLRALPFLLVGLLVTQWRTGPSLPREGHPQPDPRMVFIIASYSLAILLRVVLRVPSGGFSGGPFLPVSLILVSWMLLGVLPLRVQAWTADALSAGRTRRIAHAFCLVVVASLAISFGVRFRTRYSYPITAPRGRLWVEATTGPTIERALRFIESNTEEGETIAVLPEGSDLAFLTGRRINLRHQLLVPGFLNLQDERDAIRALEGVRFLFVVNRSMAEFGARAFGRDFYPTLGKWIEANYRVVAVLGTSGNAFPEIGDPAFFVKIYGRVGV